MLGAAAADTLQVKIYDLRDEQGRVFAFEIENITIGRKGVIQFLPSIPDVRVVSSPREDEFCIFMVRDRRFVVWEPWGDNSRFWIGPDPAEWCPEVSVVREAFAAR